MVVHQPEGGSSHGGSRGEADGGEMDRIFFADRGELLFLRAVKRGTGVLEGNCCSLVHLRDGGWVMLVCHADWPPISHTWR